MQKLIGKLFSGKGYVEVECGNSTGNTWTQWIEKDFLHPFINVTERWEDEENMVWSAPFGAARRWPSQKDHSNFNQDWLKKILGGKDVISWKYIPHPK